ncbi:exodeoxyribonuclease VII small subunit [candidate division KSB1 bacterium]|nr:MAG: exodeoxyribonuclease VII small subunit [candidate division KSB1 bacterium]
MKTENMTFEEAFARLESIVEILGSGEVSLEKSLELFEEGMELTGFCSDKLNKAELKIQKLVKEKDELQVEDFE